MEYFNQQQHLTDEGISLYVDALKRASTDQLAPNILTHIDQCPICHQQAIELYSLVASIDHSEMGAHPTLDKVVSIKTTDKSTKKETKIFSLFSKIAVAAALVGIALYFFNKLDDTAPEKAAPIVQTPAIEKEEPIREEVIAAIDSTDIQDAETDVANTPIEKTEAKTSNIKPWQKPVKKANRELLAANYTAFEELEDLTGAVVRSEEFDIKAPRLGQTFNERDPVVFTWDIDQKERLLLIVLNNKGEAIHKAIVISGAYTLEDDLLPGQYYWKLEGEEDLLYVGKFSVE